HDHEGREGGAGAHAPDGGLGARVGGHRDRGLARLRGALLGLLGFLVAHRPLDIRNADSSRSRTRRTRRSSSSREIESMRMPFSSGFATRTTRPSARIGSPPPSGLTSMRTSMPSGMFHLSLTRT